MRSATSRGTEDRPKQRMEAAAAEGGNVKNKVAVAGVTVVLGLTAGVGGASAHPVGEADDPNCHGQRVSHGSSDHGITPKDRAGFLGISVKEFHQFVRQCEPPPPEPPV